MSNEPIPRPHDVDRRMLYGQVPGASYFESKELGRKARRDVFFAALEAELKHLRLVMEQRLSQIHWDQIEEMYEELKRRMLAADSDLLQELLLEEFHAWRERSRLILGSPSYGY